MNIRSLVALAVALVLGFVAVAVLDAWRPSTSWLDRLSVWLTGVVITRAIGMFAGAPLRAAPRKRMVTRTGLLAALAVAIANLVWFPSLLWVVFGPLLDEPPSWRVDLILGGATAAVMPLYYLSARIDARAT